MSGNTPKKTFAEHKPELLVDWDYSKNKLSPHEMSYKSRSYVWWKCHKCSHSWNQAVKGRKGSQDSCPKCNSLGNLFPEIAKDWDYDKNNLTPYDIPKAYSKKVSWKCHKCGYKWKFSVAGRTVNNNQCENCSKTGNNTSKIERKIFFFIKKIHKVKVKSGHRFSGHMSVDIFIPSKKIAIEYDGEYWHKNKEEQDKNKNKFLKEKGIKLIRVRENGLNKLCDEDIIYNWSKGSMNCLIEEIVSYITLNDSERKRYNDLMNLDLDLYKIPKEYMIYPLRENSLAETHPHMLSEWDYQKNDISPDLITFGQNIKIWWRCSSCCGSWYTIPYIKVRNIGTCKTCKHNIIPVTKTHIHKEWDYDKNNEDPSIVGSKNALKKYWWKCKCCSESYQATTISKFNTKSCPNHECEESTYNSFGVLKSRVNCENSILNRFPILAKEWDVLKNKITPDQIPYTTNKKAWWICHRCDYEWESRIDGRTSKGSVGKCPKCRWS